MNVTLERSTHASGDICGRAAALCTDSSRPTRALKGAMDGGHESVLEHAVFTFSIEGVSRALLAQLTRHRIASFSVQSQRYVDMENFRYVTPETIKADDDLLELYDDLMDSVRRFYHEAVRCGIPKEDARFVLPNATCTKLMMTMNARELRHFFSLRMCNRAQWEIRELADRMFRLCYAEAPELFRGAGCACMAGKPCPEGKQSCGHPRTAEEV